MIRSGLIWDEFEVSEFFLHESASFELEDDQGRIYRVRDERLIAEVIVLPVHSVLCFTLRDASCDHIVMDLSVHARTGLSVRRAGSMEYLYCHECTVLPGIHSYQELRWDTFFRYVWFQTSSEHQSPLLSIRFTWAPYICLQFLDIAHDNQAM